MPEHFFYSGETSEKKEIKKFLATKELVRGVVFKTDMEYFLETKGKEGLAAVQKAITGLGCPLVYEKIETMDFYPLGWRIISLLAARDILGFSDEEIKKMGSAAPKFSLVVKIFLKYFSSISKTTGQVPSMWAKHYTAGRLVVAESDEEKKEIVIRMEELSLHPIFCLYLLGYFSSITQMVVGSAVIGKETACAFKQGTYHEYTFNW